jgi:ketosteroid isomerase-like protein
MTTTTTEIEDLAAESTRAETFVAAFAEGWRAPRGAAGLVEAFRPLLCEDVRLVQPQMPTTVGLEGFRRGFAEPLFALIPDLRGEVEEWAARGDEVFIVVRLSGTLGGRPVEFRSCDHVTLREGRIAQRVAYTDPLALLGAAARRPRAWPAAIRAQAANLRRTIRRDR